MHRILLEENELSIFQAIASEQLDVVFPMSYLESSSVYAVVDSTQSERDPSAWLGGFLVKAQPSFRALEGLPDPTIIVDVCSLSDLAEVNALWVRTDRRNGFMALFALHMIAQSVKSEGKDFAIYCYAREQVPLARIYSRARPVRIYSGPTRRLEGMTKSTYENVEILRASDLCERIQLRYPRFQPTRRASPERGIQ